MTSNVSITLFQFSLTFLQDINFPWFKFPDFSLTFKSFFFPLTIPDRFLPRGKAANAQPRSQGLSRYPGNEVVIRLAYVSYLPLEPILQETSYLPERRTAEWLWCKLQVQTCHPTRCADSETRNKTGLSLNMSSLFAGNFENEVTNLKALGSTSISGVGYLLQLFNTITKVCYPLENS